MENEIFFFFTLFLSPKQHSSLKFLEPSNDNLPKGSYSDTINSDNLFDTSGEMCNLSLPQHTHTNTHTHTHTSYNVVFGSIVRRIS